MEDKGTKTPYREREWGYRRISLSTSVSRDLYNALAIEAAERKVSLSAHAANVLAEHAGVPA